MPSSGWEAWAEDRICLALKVRPDKFKKLLAGDDNRALTDFISSPDTRRVWFAEDTKGLQCFSVPPPALCKKDSKKKLCYFLKLHRVVRRRPVRLPLR
jgi:hypothetical protein